MGWFPPSMMILIIYYLLKKLLEGLKGSTIFIYGPRASGKTTLAKFLTTGEIYEKYKYIRTQNVETYEPVGKKINLMEFEFNIEKIITSPGSVYPDDDLEVTKISYKILKGLNYNYLFYVFDVSKIYNNDNKYIQCIEVDLEIMKNYVTNKKILLIGTHLDILNLKNIEEDRETIEEQILNIKVFTKMINELQKNNKVKGLIIGSLKDKTFAGELTLRILKAMKELKKA